MSDLLETLAIETEQLQSLFKRFMTEYNNQQYQINQGLPVNTQMLNFYKDKIAIKQKVIDEISQALKKCQEAKQRIKDAKSKMNQANVEVKDIQDKAKRALLALTKEPVGPKFLEPTPFAEKLKKAYMSDIVEYANQITHLNQPYMFNNSVLSNKFDEKNRSPQPVVYPNDKTLFQNDMIKIECQSKKAEIYYTLNSNQVPTSFSGTKYMDPGIDVRGQTFVEIYCIAMIPGRLESILVQKHYKVEQIDRPHDRQLQMQNQDETIIRDAHQLEDVKSMSGNGIEGFGDRGMDLGDEMSVDELGTPQRQTPSLMKELSLQLGMRPSTNPYQRSRRNTDMDQYPSEHGGDDQDNIDLL